MSGDQTPRKGDIRWAESGEILFFDGHDWQPILHLPGGGPVVFRQEQEIGDVAEAEEAGDGAEPTNVADTGAAADTPAAAPEADA